MFDIGFTELLIVAVVALLVVGPERLPEAVKTAALWLGRARGMLTEAKDTIKDEIGMDDIHQQLHNENVLNDLKQAQKKIDQTKNSIRSFEAEAMDQLKQSVESPSDQGTPGQGTPEQDTPKIDTLASESDH